MNTDHITNRRINRWHYCPIEQDYFLSYHADCVATHQRLLELEVQTLLARNSSLSPEVLA